jgi:hypothetical protein
MSWPARDGSFGAFPLLTKRPGADGILLTKRARVPAQHQPACNRAESQALARATECGVATTAAAINFAFAGY